MGQSDWTWLTSTLTAGIEPTDQVRAGPTYRPDDAPPGGDGTQRFVMRRIAGDPGAVALRTAPTISVGFDPMPAGGAVWGAMKRSALGPATATPFLFLGLGGTSVNDTGYILGLSNGDPCHIELRKGALNLGLPDETPLGASGILGRSTDRVPANTWTILRLCAVVNGNQDVVLSCERAVQLRPDPLTIEWLPISGIERVVDDALGIYTGSMPLTSGHAGFGSHFGPDLKTWAAFDAIGVGKQI